MTTTSIRDVKSWIEKLANRGIIKFRYRDLPDDLKSKKMLHKGRVSGLLRSNKKENALSLWEISYKGKRELKTIKNETIKMYGLKTIKTRIKKI